MNGGASTPMVTRSDCLKCLFREANSADPGTDLQNRITAFVNLTWFFVNDWIDKHPEESDVWDFVHFDYHALRLMLGRFQRDAFGIKKFIKYLDKLESSNQIPSGLRSEIENKILVS
jgi:hypothetical protein